MEEKKIRLKNEQELEAEHKLLSERHGTVYQVQVNLDADDQDQTCNVFVRHPNRADYNQIVDLYKVQSINAVEYWVKTGYAGGDPLEIVLTNDYALRSMELALMEVLYVQPSELVKEETQEKKELSKVHRQAFEIDVKVEKDSEETKKLWLRYPSRTEYNEFMRLYRFDLMGALEYFVKNCWIAGWDPQDLAKNDYALRSLDWPVSGIVYVRQSLIKKK